MVYKPLIFTEGELRYFLALEGTCLMANGFDIGSSSPLFASFLTTSGFLAAYLSAMTYPLPEPREFKFPRCLENKVD